jgi:MFS family permease
LSNLPENAAYRTRAWIHVALVFLFMLVNFADKAVVGLSSVPIMRELGLSNTQFGELGSAFFLLFSISGVAGGFLANRVRTKILMFAMAVVWGVALLPVSLASSFGLLLLSRIVLGAAEGPAFPVALHAVYKWFPDRLRALPTSVVACGAAFGTGVIAPLITWIIVHHGWHRAFGALGAAGLLWACLWFIVAEDGPIDDDTARSGAERRVPYRRLMSSRTAIGVFLAGFGAYWVIALNITWLANYLMKALHFAPAQAAWIVGLPSVLQMILAPSLALLSQVLIRYPGCALRGDGRCIDDGHGVLAGGTPEGGVDRTRLLRRQCHIHVGVDADRRDFARLATRRDAGGDEFHSHAGGPVRSLRDGAHRGCGRESGGGFSHRVSLRGCAGRGLGASSRDLDRAAGGPLQVRPTRT